MPLLTLFSDLFHAYPTHCRTTRSPHIAHVSAAYGGCTRVRRGSPSLERFVGGSRARTRVPSPGTLLGKGQTVRGQPTKWN